MRRQSRSRVFPAAVAALSVPPTLAAPAQANASLATTGHPCDRHPASAPGGPTNVRSRPLARVLSILVAMSLAVAFSAVASPGAAAAPPDVAATLHHTDPNALVAASEIEVITKVFEADRPELAYRQFSAAERAEFDRWTMPARMVEVSSAATHTAVTDANAQSVSCWSAYRSYRARSLAGIDLYEIWLQAGWCTDDVIGGAVSATYHSSGGSGLNFGWQHDGRRLYGFGVPFLYDRAYIWAQHTFVQRLGSIPLNRVNQCLRIIGGPFSTTNQDLVCSP